MVRVFYRALDLSHAHLRETVSSFWKVSMVAPEHGLENRWYRKVWRSTLPAFLQNWKVTQTGVCNCLLNKLYRKVWDSISQLSAIKFWRPKAFNRWTKSRLHVSDHNGNKGCITQSDTRSWLAEWPD